MVRGSNPAKVNEWTERLMRFADSNLSVARFCQNEGVSPPSFYQWRNKLRNRLPDKEARKMRTANSVMPSMQRTAFEAVQVNATGPPEQTPAMTVCLASGVRVHVGNDLAAIEVVMREVLSGGQQDSGATPC